MRGLIALLLAVATLLVLPALTCAQEAGDEWTEPITGMEFVWVPGGCYEMGCGEWAGDDCGEDDFPVQEVCVDGFWIGKYEVTQAQWYLLMESPSVIERLGNNALYPKIYVTWEDVQSYTRLLNAFYFFRHRYRLPFETEWEFACRSGGREELYSGSNVANDVGWYSNNSDGARQIGGMKQPNGIGIYDMSGNVWEWVQDNYYQNFEEIDLGQDTRNTSSVHVLRGGGWHFSYTYSMCISRTTANYGESDIGFRLVMY